MESITLVAECQCRRWEFTILCAVSLQFSDEAQIHAEHTEEHTIAIDSTMGARLLAVAFDLLASTSVAGTRHTSSLLGLVFRCLIVTDVIRL